MTCIKEKFLFVDDDTHILDGFKRRFRGKVDLTLCESPAMAIQAINQLAEEGQEFAVVVSDMQMPGMNGASFLEQVKEKSPNTIRMMLTGQSNLESAMAAVNTGEVFRFLLKPCDAKTLGDALVSGLEQYRLKMLESYFFDLTLTGTVKMLMEMIYQFMPEMQLQTKKVKSVVDYLLQHSNREETWDMNVAIMLLALPNILLNDQLRQNNASVSGVFAKEDADKIEHSRTLISEWLSAIPKMETVSRLLILKSIAFDATDSDTYKQQETNDDKEAFMAQIIRVAEYYVQLEKNHSHHQVVEKLDEARGQYDPVLVDYLRSFDASKSGVSTKTIRVSELEEGMEIAQEIKTSTGLVLVKAGMFANKPLMSRLSNYIGTGLIDDVVNIYG